MINFRLLPEGVPWRKLQKGDHVIIEDRLWRVVQNYPSMGGGHMLMLAFHTHTDPKTYKFYPIGATILDQRQEVFHKETS